MKILLVGNPNVGKSAIFSRLTGVRVMVSNYPGTTVGLATGHMRLGKKMADLVDLPGIYSLRPSSGAERVAVKMLAEADLIINVVDATNLERNLYLTLELLERNVPVVVALNMWDEAAHRGTKIDWRKLGRFLRVPVAPVVGVTGEGVKDLAVKVRRAASPSVRKHSHLERWKDIGKIISRVQKLSYRHHTLGDWLREASVRPLTGFPIAGAVIYATFKLVRWLGEGLIDYVLDPLFYDLYWPVLRRLSEALGGAGILHGLLIGELTGGAMDFKQAFGLLSTGLYVPVGMVLPYILAFYLGLGLLEDTGYLPRLAVLLDVFLHRLGLHGYAIVPMILGIGCNVPGILATRVLESKRERFIACTALSIGVPCAALQAMILGLLGGYGGKYVAYVYLALFCVWLLTGYALNKFTHGYAPEMFLEIPPYRRPYVGAVLKKLWMRVMGFLREALPIVLGGVLVINLLYLTGLFDILAMLAAPLVEGVFGLPRESAIVLLIGFLRKDVAVGMLVPLGLTAAQMVVACVVLATFFPCIASFVILLRELGWRDFLKSMGVMVIVSILAGGVLNLLLN